MLRAVGKEWAVSRRKDWGNQSRAVHKYDSEVAIPRHVTSVSAISTEFVSTWVTTLQSSRVLNSIVSKLRNAKILLLIWVWSLEIDGCLLS